MTISEASDFAHDSAVAIIGVAGRFPGANDPVELWRNISGGVMSIRQFTDAELLAAGADPRLIAQPNYVKAGTVIDKVDHFDAGFFGYTPREAEVMDPQLRLFLECAWEALEQGGYDPERSTHLVGVFAGAAISSYFVNNLLPNAELVDLVGIMPIAIANSADSLASTVAYKLNFKGPSVAVQTFCSTSLVATHLACQSLLNYECDMALAGGVALSFPHGQGYTYQEGGITSPDGQVRTFDAQGQGSVMSNGTGAVLLKRLDEALEDGDQIYAVIRGSAVNNDGQLRVGYTAPGLEGQSEVIAEALGHSGVDPETISYIETHGTATPLGDSIEIAAMIRAFRKSTAKKQFCAIGSVKPNVGHLDRASGVTGLIKTALALHHRQLPPSLNFERPNPDFDLDNSPFFVNTQLRDWPRNGTPRRAGVSSFGVGGTNAHLVLEEAPERRGDAPARPQHLLLLSAKTPGALEAQTERLARHLAQHPEQELADVAYTLQVGRSGFNHRRALVARDRDEAVRLLGGAEPARLPTAHQTGRDRAVAFLLPGVGEHYPGMARELYEREPVFQAALDECCDLLSPLVGQDLRPLLFPADQPAAGGAGGLKALLGRGPQSGAEAGPLHQTALAQPAVFAVEYALAQLLTSWGIEPSALLGYSLGEYVAACLAGVFSLKDALKLVATRAKLIQALPNGVMLAVQAGADALQPYLGGGVDLAAANTPGMSVLAGPEQAIAAVEARLAQAEIACRRIATSHAFHSQMLAPAAAELTALARTITLSAPQTPYLSNVTGTWVTAAEATDPSYWAKHMVQTVRFSEAVATLLGQGDPTLLEVGPGAGLTALVRQHPACGRERLAQVVPTLPAQHEAQDAQASLLGALGKLWLAGVTLDWSTFYGEERRLRVALPTYPFERQRFWVDPPQRAQAGLPALGASAGKKADIADWFYRPVWADQPLAAAPAARGPWLIFADAAGLGQGLAEQLAGQTVIVARPGAAFAQLDGQQYTLRPTSAEDYKALLEALERQGQTPQVVLHLWSLDTPAGTDRAAFEAARQHGFDSVVALAQALGAQLRDTPLPLLLITRGLQAAEAGDIPQAEQGVLVGLRTVIGQEYAALRARLIDLPAAPEAAEAALLVAEVAASDDLVAYRGGKRLVQQFAPQRLEPASPSRLRSGGVYVITGGLGGVGLLLGLHMARTYQARLALVGRSGLPERTAWDAWLAEHPEDDRTSQRIRKVQALEEAGAEVLLLTADVADPAQLAAALEAAEARFGPINGVLHAAGVSDASTFGVLDSLTEAQCEAHFQPKVYGLYALEQALAGRTLDFCLLFSSISAVLGGLGLGAYAAANSFMDAFAQRHTRADGTPWITVNWDAWRVDASQTGMAGLTLQQYEMDAAEGAEAFERVIATDASAPVVNSTGDLDARIRQWLRLESLRGLDDSADESASGPAVAPGDYEGRIAAIWQQVLGVAQVGLHDNFFDLGGNSLTSLQVIAKLKKEFKVQVPAVALFEAPTVSALAQYLRPSLPQQADPQQSALVRRRTAARQAAGSQDIAIVGMHGRFPGASSVEQFWDNLRNGVEALTHFSNAELLAAGVDPMLIQHPGYVKCRPVLDDVTHFDAAFFGYTPREAELMDPQQRLFHECVWEALELAGYDTQRFPGLVGMFGGSNLNMYLLRMASDPELEAAINESVILENDKDALVTNVAYKLNLRGPSFAVQTFCSTSLVATHLACRSLQNGECDMAIAGGVSVRVPVTSGYLYQEGDQVSPDGHVRTFDAKGEGATFGDGVAVVVLKRLADAIEDGDTIHGVIKASAINNDGSLKIGYTAPSVVGQSEVVVSALQQAGIDPTTISYVEAHGTATRLGDPIEVASLTRAYRQFTDRKGFCLIGSVKPNVGHLDRAAGVTGLIKTVMAIKHGQIPATLHFESPNPEIDFESSPFVVSAALQPWPTLSGPRRAAVNSLGVGGTNAHVIVEEAPAQAPSSPGRPFQLLLLSARTSDALETATGRLRDALSQNPELNLADVAYTLQVGRRVFEHRRALVARDREEALALLGGAQPARVWTAAQKPTTRTVAFLLPGVGEHYPGMARALYERELVFQAALDRCCAQLQPLVGQDLRPLLFPADQPAAGNGSLKALLGRGPQTGAEASPLHQTALAQPAVFAVEYALAQLLISWGVQPSALLGYSLGEYVAACLAGVLSLEDALKLVATRAKLIQALPNGVMLAVQSGADALQPYLGGGVELAAVNTPAMSVLAGPEGAIAAVEARLAQAEIACRRIATSHAFHSQMLAPAAEELTALARTLKLSPPRIPYLSNVTGTWITEEQATDPSYWATHMVQTVRFGEAVATLLGQGDPALLEVGPGAGLTALVRQHPACGRERLNQVVPTLPAQHEAQDAQAALLGALGKLWLLDVLIGWSEMTAGEQRRRIPLPTYPFERQRFWVDPRPEARGTTNSPIRRADLADWFTVPSWTRTRALAAVGGARLSDEPRCWLLLADSVGVGAGLARWLTERDQQVVTVTPGGAYAKQGAGAYTVRPTVRADYQTLLRDMHGQGLQPAQVVHLWTVTPPLADRAEQPAIVAELLDRGFYSLLALTQALGEQGLDFCRVAVVSNEVQDVTGAEQLCPVKATVIGPAKVIPQDHNNITSCSIDISLPASLTPDQRLIELLADELTFEHDDDLIALRGPHRWVQTYEPAPLQSPKETPLRQRGVYMLTGGLGGIALAMAEHLASSVQARLVLLNRTGLPERAAWDAWLAEHPEDDRTSERIRKVRAIEAAGGEVLVVQADVAQPEQVRTAVEQSLKHFGALHGVLHTAGVPGVGLMQLKTAESAAAVLAPKVQGTHALAEALRDVPLDFLVLFSSVTSAASGGPGQADYCASNAFLDAFARRHAGEYGRTVSISWGEWLWDAWNEGLKGHAPDVQIFLKANRRAYGLTFEEGFEVLRRILASGLEHVFATTQDLTDMVAQSRRLSAVSQGRQRQSEQQARPRYPRPALGTSYIEPGTPAEKTIAAIWQEMLGIEQVGLNDNFFELGGNSLLGVDLIGRIRRALDIETLPVHILYDAPSVGALAAEIARDQQGEAEEDDLEERDSRRKEQLDFLKRRAQTEEFA